MGRGPAVQMLPFVLSLMLPPRAEAHAHEFRPGADGIGDPYFPLAGNGGYDVAHYHIDVAYDPGSGELRGQVTVTATATQGLSQFDLDLDGLVIDEVTVDHRGARWARDGGELVITPGRGIRERARFVTVVRYHGVPQTVTDGALGVSGFVHTDDGAVVVGQPRVAATWFPANDHPRDAARFTLDIAAPSDLEVIAVGRLVGRRTRGGRTTWRWEVDEPMATYLVGLAIGRYAVDSYRERGRRFVDAIDVDLFQPRFAPRTGSAVAYSGRADLAYKRITRELFVPTAGASLSFFVQRDTEEGFDFFFVEARPAGTDEWTTLPDAAGFASQDVGACAVLWHPFVEHYQAVEPLPTPGAPCVPRGATGEWWAASGASAGAERWEVDLSRYAGQVVEVSLAYASDESVQLDGVAIDDISFSGDGGTTSFENGDTGGWQVPGATPPGTSNANDWFVTGAADLPRAPGEVIHDHLGRQPEILAFLESLFGPYPYREAGAIVHDAPLVGFALENQTRPIYPASNLRFAEAAVSLIVHELAHQWFGDRARLREWQDMWLNEGFATYAEWLWADKEGIPIDVIFDAVYATPETSPFWGVMIADPGPASLFHPAVYRRGAMTLHQLRRTIGDEPFFAILRQWASRERIATTSDFVTLAAQVSGQNLDNLFEAWLFTAAKPGALSLAPAAMASGFGHCPVP